jgi:hypothetical protein
MSVAEGRELNAARRERILGMKLRYSLDKQLPLPRVTGIAVKRQGNPYCSLLRSR